MERLLKKYKKYIINYKGKLTQYMNEFSRKIKKLCEKYIEERDIVHIIKIFAPITKYSLSSLIEIAKDQSNEEILVLFLDKYSMNEFSLEREYVLFVRNYVRDNNNNTDRMYSYNEENTSIKTIFYYVLKFIFVWYYYEFFSVQKTKVLEDFEIEKDDDFKENCIENKHNFVFYRGQSNKDWRLSPSIIRGLNGDIYLDDDYYYDLLQKDGSEAKYNQLIRCEDRNAYSKYAFMQHARSFSPFIDLTYSKEIATSFALSNSNNVNTFRNIEAAIFEIKINNCEQNTFKDESEARLFLKNDFDLKIINDDYFILCHKYYLKKYGGKLELICIKSFKELFKALTPKYKIFQIYTNDRMKYQKGLFLCFYDCICLKDFIVYDLIDDFEIIEFTIPFKIKNAILKKIYEHRRYDPEHLMNPYLFFQE